MSFYRDGHEPKPNGEFEIFLGEEKENGRRCHRTGLRAISPLLMQAGAFF
jgi:hypothetical protein